MKNLIASAPSKEALQGIINKYYYSNHYIITDDNRVFNTKRGDYADGVKVVQKKNRWRFELA